MAIQYKIEETTDWYPLSELFHTCGMEVAVSKTAPEGIVKMWRMVDAANGKLLAAATLEKRDTVYTLGDIGVRPDLQKQGFGRILQNVVFDAARAMGIPELWGSAKVPKYYYQFGWEKKDWNTSPRVAEKCHTCNRRGKDCFPEILRIKL